jgi:glycosyltransferase involved in cell wall biosynthesis
MNTEEAAHCTRHAFPQLREKPVRAVANAFDPRDFAQPPPIRGDRGFRVVHTGSLHTEQGTAHRDQSLLRRALGGSVAGVDFLPRSYVFLVQAVERVLQRRPELAEVVEVQFAGVLTAREREALKALSYVRVLGFLPHDRTIALIRSADLLFLPMHDLPAGRRATIVPHKTYEYIASGRPILAAVPDGDAHDLLAASGTAKLCRPSDVEAMARVLEGEIERWRRGEAPPVPRPDLVERCSAPRLAGNVAAVFDEVLSRSSR